MPAGQEGFIKFETLLLIFASRVNLFPEQRLTIEFTVA